jgi:hypothetical protein
VRPTISRYRIEWSRTLSRDQSRWRAATAKETEPAVGMEQVEAGRRCRMALEAGADDVAGDGADHERVLAR